jgi:hypothetical protein
MHVVESLLPTDCLLGDQIVLALSTLMDVIRVPGQEPLSVSTYVARVRPENSSTSQVLIHCIFLNHRYILYYVQGL